MTDRAGRFALSFGFGSRLVGRVCGRENAALVRLDMRPGGTTPPIVVRLAPRPLACAPLARPPWEVDARDTSVLDGYAVYSWEGPPHVVACSGSSFTIVDWTAETWKLVWGDRTPAAAEYRYVRLQGRWNDDPTTLEFTGGWQFFVRRVVATSVEGPPDCPVPPYVRQLRATYRDTTNAGGRRTHEPGHSR